MENKCTNTYGLYGPEKENGIFIEMKTILLSMTEEEAKTAYDSLFKVEPTERLRGFSLSNTSAPM